MCEVGWMLLQHSKLNGKIKVLKKAEKMEALEVWWNTIHRSIRKTSMEAQSKPKVPKKKITCFCSFLHPYALLRAGPDVGSRRQCCAIASLSVGEHSKRPTSWFLETCFDVFRHFSSPKSHTPWLSYLYVDIYPSVKAILSFFLPPNWIFPRHICL